MNLPQGERRGKCLLLDRDGVINIDTERGVVDARELNLYPTSIAAMARACKAGWRIAICTNQANVGRGILSMSDLASINRIISDAVCAAGGKIASWHICPHRPEDGCRCRKPEPGLLFDACRTLGALPAETPFIGDSLSDILAAEAAGCSPIVVRSGKGTHTCRLRPDIPAYDDLEQTIDALLREDS